MPSLHAVPDTPRRAVLYLRQSTAQEETISDAVQRRAALDYCARHGYQIIHLDDPKFPSLTEGELWEQHTGRAWHKRAGVNRALALVETGHVDVIVLWRWDRLSRRRLHWAAAEEKVAQLGGSIESATEPSDITTAAGRFNRNVLVDMAEMESDRIGEGWKAAHTNRLVNGLPHGGGPRFGYHYADKHYSINPDTAQVVSELYASYITGDGFRGLALDLNARGIRNGRGQPWTETGMRYYLLSGFAAGLLPVGASKGTRNITYRQGTHHPIIDQDTWRAFLAAHDARKGDPPRSTVPAYPLSGLLRCGDCGAAMTSCKGGTGQTGSTYQCSRWRKAGDVACVTVSRVRAEAKVKAWLADYAENVSAEPQPRKAPKLAVDTAAREVADLDRQMVALTRQLGRDVIPESVYAAAMNDLNGEREAAQRRLDLAEHQARLTEVPTAGVAFSALEHWDLIPASDLRKLLKTLIRVVWVHRQPKRYARAAVEIVPVWADTNETFCV